MADHAVFADFRQGRRLFPQVFAGNELFQGHMRNVGGWKTSAAAAGLALLEDQRLRHVTSRSIDSRDTTSVVHSSRQSLRSSYHRPSSAPPMMPSSNRAALISPGVT